MCDLYMCVISGDGDGAIATVNAIIRFLSIAQKTEIVQKLVAEIKAQGGMQDVGFINVLKDSIYNTQYFY